MSVIETSLIFSFQKGLMANIFYDAVISQNVYVGIGQENPYQDADSLVPVPNMSTDYVNGIWRAMISLKKIEGSDLAFVVPRVDWQSGVTYQMWDNEVDLYSTILLTPLDGQINVNNSRTITGINTSFLLETTQGALLYIPGDGLNVAPQTLQITDIFSNTSLNVNTAVSGNIILNTVSLVTNTAPFYAYPFYVRNSYDQVFVCLENASSTQSTSMPVLSLGGDLPTDPYIIMPDGYQWKYLYTIPSGNKQLFLSDDWMPVYSDPTTSAYAQQNYDQSIDVVIVEAAGTGYNQNVASNTAQIITIEGDGLNADVVASVNAAGGITGVTVLNGGTGYTQANVILNGGVTGQGAVLRAIIGPQGGHGFDPVSELGVSTLQLTMPIGTGEDNSFIPTQAEVGGGLFEYRQISLIANPLLANVASGQPDAAGNLNYSTVSTISVQPLPGDQFFQIDETVWQSASTMAEATFLASVVYWDADNSEVWVNNMVGEFTPAAPIVGTFQTTPVTAFSMTDPEIALFSGKVLYVNNIEPIIRSPDQIEYIRVLLRF